MTKMLACSEVWGGFDAADTDFRTPGVDGALFSRPIGGDKAGGDIYLVSSCDEGQVCKIVLADVSGHGQAVERVSRMLAELLRQNVSERDNDRFLDALNQQFQAEDRGSLCFATLACGTYFARQARFCFAYAGHPPILLGHAGRFKLLDVQAGPADRIANLPIGIERSADFHQGCLQLTVGDWLVFCSDGLLEARNEVGQQYGVARMVADLNRLAPTSPMALKNGLMTRLRDFVAPRQLDQDDLTLIVLAVRELPAQPLVTMSPALAKMMGRVGKG
jgi:serine phosphatase RsbU (regulator of sigma subunit)